MRERQRITEEELRWQWAFDKTAWESFGEPFFAWFRGERPIRRIRGKSHQMPVPPGCRWSHDPSGESELDDIGAYYMIGASRSRMMTAR